MTRRGTHRCAPVSNDGSLFGSTVRRHYAVGRGFQEAQAGQVREAQTEQRAER